MKVVVVSDIHLNSYSSKKDKFIEFVKNLKADILVINGDLYDLYISPPKEEIIYKIKENKDIKSIVYIIGNHDFYIKDYFPDYTVQEVFRIADVLITHGHQYDILSNEFPPKDGFFTWFTKARYWIEKTFKLNLRILFKKITFGLIDKILIKAHDKAIKENPYKKVVLGHTHKSICVHPYYNSGCMVDDHFSYLVINIIDGLSHITLIDEQT